MNKSAGDPMADNPRNTDLLLARMLVIFVFIWLIGSFFLFIRGEAANSQQRGFRVGVFAVGAVGTVIVGILQFIRRRGSGR
jgi:hypothetical protein